MRVILGAVGRLKASAPEQVLTRDWIGRADSLGRRVGIKSVRLLEIDPRLPAPDPAREAEALLAALEPGTVILALDERGEQPGSTGLSALFARHRDQGVRDLALLVGGADGHGPAIASAASARIAFGPWVWPHMLVRAMAAEQIYRAISIEAGTPYHRV